MVYFIYANILAYLSLIMAVFYWLLFHPKKYFCVKKTNEKKAVIAFFNISILF